MSPKRRRNLARRMNQRPESASAESPFTAADAMVRIRLELGYDGTDFHGWAKQPGLRTVEGVVEASFEHLIRTGGYQQNPAITVAGRTDAGVHARCQSAHLDLPLALWERRGPDRLVGELNANLPVDVRVSGAEVVPVDFDARFSALSRSYTYRIYDRTTYLHPLDSRFAVAHRVALDHQRMSEAGTHLLGEHDFAAFCRRREGASTVRTLLQCDAARESDREILFTISADAFCHSMVRSLVGALVSIGEGRQTQAWLRDLLLRDTRSDAVKVMPASGLVLEGIRYPGLAETGRQAQRARRFRTRPNPAASSGAERLDA